ELVIDRPEDLHLPGAVGRPRDDVGPAVAIDIGRPHVHAGDGRVVCHEALQQGQVHAAEDLQLGAATLARAGDDVGPLVAVDVAGPDAHPAGEQRVVGDEAVQKSQVPAAEDLPLVAAALARAGDDVVEPVGVDVPAGHVDARPEQHAVGEETAQQSPVRAAEDLDDTAAAAGAGDDIDDAI